MDFNLCKDIITNIARVMVGKQESIELLLVSLLGGGHVLIEDVPGVGKTLLAKSLAKSIGGVFKRIQFTPDLLPSDITGFNVYNQKTGQFTFQPGPVMANILLADEINRTIPRTQSSLLESMEEHQVTVDNNTLMLPDPFFVIATQNPIELEGTFPLPEAQLDRFLLRISIGYPDKNEEMTILERFHESDPLQDIASVIKPEQIVEMQKARCKIHLSKPVCEYIVNIVEATRIHPALRFGASPRGSLGLMRSSQALAALRGRDYVLPDDVKYLTFFALSHRLILKDEEKLRGNSTGKVLESIIDSTNVPGNAV